MPAPRRVCAVLALVLVMSASVAAAAPPGLAAAESPPSTMGLLLAEVVTGGASASDEYVEITNAGSVEVDLGGSDLIYVTASGATTTRKALFTSPQMLASGQHLLVANAAGIYGSMADVTYTGGLAADGGVLALRSSGGSVIDAVGWGTATNGYVEGVAAPAPPARSSLERKPGGPAGNTLDTNDNRSDWFIQPNPIPQSRASTPTGGADSTPTLSADASVAPTPEPTVTAPEPTPDATSSAPATETSEPTVTALEPTAGVTHGPTPAEPSAPPTEPEPTPVPTESAVTSAAPSPAPSATPSPKASASPSPTATIPDQTPISVARSRTPGSVVHVIGVVTASPGFTGTEGLFAIEDSSGGVYVRWTDPADGLVPGATADVVGVVAAPYGQTEIRELGLLAIGTPGDEPAPTSLELADIGEATEAQLVSVRGSVGSVTTESGRLTIVVTDGSAAIRAIADPNTGLSIKDVSRGDAVVVVGIVGQRASATGKEDGYKIWLRSRSDLELVNVEANPPFEPAPTALQTPPPSAKSVVVLRDLSSLADRRGTAVDIEAVVTATAGLLDINGPTIVVDDGVGSVGVILPAGTAAPGVGMSVHVTGKVGSWQGGPTILASYVASEGELRAVQPSSVNNALGSSVEWRLVRVCGLIGRVTRAGSRWRVELLVNGRQVVVLGEPAAGISIASSSVGRLAMVTGIVRRSSSDSTQFQLLPRTPLDLRLGPSAASSGISAQPVAGAAGVSAVVAASGAPADGPIAIGSVAGYLGLDVTVVGLVTATADSEATIDDGSGQIRIGGPDAAEALSLLEPGDAVEVAGNVAQDEQGLLIRADAASIVILPGGDAAASSAPDGAVELAAGNNLQSATPGPGLATSIRQVASTAPVPDALSVLGVVALVLLGAATCLAVTRRRKRADGRSDQSRQPGSEGSAGGF